MVSIDQFQLAPAAGVTPDKVTFHMQMTGGSFGRRATARSTSGIEALSIVRAMGIDTPLKLMYGRCDDMAGPHNAYRPAFVHRLDAGLDAQGRLVAWKHRLAGQSIATGTLMEGAMVHDGVDFSRSKAASISPTTYRTCASKCTARRIRSRRRGCALPACSTTPSRSNP